MTVEAGPFELRVRGRVLRFDGYTRVLPPASRKGDLAEVPGYETGERLDCTKLEPAQHFTKPPPRYSEASLVRELEKRGIGRTAVDLRSSDHLHHPGAGLRVAEEAPLLCGEDRRSS